MPYSSDALFSALLAERERLESMKVRCESHIAYMEHLSGPEIYRATSEYRDEMSTLAAINARLDAVARLLSSEPIEV